MRPYTNAVIDGINTLLAELHAQDVETHIFVFSHEWREVAYPLTRTSYITGGRTRLRDAMMDMFQRIRIQVEDMHSTVGPETTWLVVQTDGNDNRSRSSRDAVRVAQEMFVQDGYQFLMMTTGDDAALESQSMSISGDHHLSYDAGQTQEELEALLSRLSSSRSRENPPVRQTVSYARVPET